MEDEEVRDLYYRVLHVANFFLREASHLTIDALKEFDPSVAEIARTMRVLASILKEIASSSYENENMAINAIQCCIIMERIADVVRCGDDGDLEKLVKDLEMHTNVP